MKQSIHQSLSVNTFQTNFSGFKSELHMQGVIYDNQKLIAFGENDEPNILAREFNLQNVGRIDLLVESDEEIGIIELKNKQIDDQAFMQLKGYLDYVIDNPNIFNDKIERVENRESNSFYGLLIGTSINEQTIYNILVHNNNINNLYKIYVILLTRHQTDNDNLFIVSTPIISRNNNLNSSMSVYRDYSKYSFNGQIYGKSRLVLAVLKHYIKQNSNTSLLQLQELFPPSLQGTFQLIESVDNLDVRKYSRYFMNDPVTLNNEDLVICTQWGIGNIENFIKKANDNLGYSIEKTQ